MKIEMKRNENLLAKCIVLIALLLTAPGPALAETVVVRPGDTLVIIAERELGDRNRFREICELNLRTLRHDCNYLIVGTELILPEGRAVPRAAVKKQPPKKPAPNKQTPSRRDSGERSTISGDYVGRFGRFSRQTLNAVEPYEISLERNFARLSGHVSDAPSDGKPGIWLKVPRFIQRRVSGKTIRVKARVRAPTPGPIALAYSRTDVGSSGWITKGAGTKFRILTFTYRVPPTTNFDGDYVGILPDPMNARQRIDVAEIAIEILEDSSISQTGEVLGPSAKEWSFDYDAEGFSAANGTVTWQPRGSIEVTATGGDVQFRSPTELSISGAESTVISARLRVTAFWSSRPGWQGQIYYKTLDHGYSERFSKKIPDPSLVLNEWVTLRWDMAKLTKGGADWVNSAITQFRIDLQNGKKEPYGSVEFDWIRVDSR